MSSPPPPGYGGYGNYGAYGPPFGVPQRRVVNSLGITLALIGGGAVLIGAFFDWYGEASLQDIVHALDDANRGEAAFPKLYFGGVMWVVIAATVAAALFANAAVAMSTALRVTSPILGLVGAALVMVSSNDLTHRSAFDHASSGLYVTLVGFLVAGLAGVFGPRRVY